MSKLTVGILRKFSSSKVIAKALEGYPDDMEINEGELVFMPKCIAYAWWDEDYVLEIAGDVMCNNYDNEEIPNDKLEEVLDFRSEINNAILSAIDDECSVYDAVFDVIYKNCGPGSEDDSYLYGNSWGWAD